MAMREISDASFDSEVLNADGAVLVDFSAQWCGPCKVVAKQLEALEAENATGVKIVTIDIEDNPDAAGKYGVTSLPTLMLFNNGELRARQVGAMQKNAIARWIESAL